MISRCISCGCLIDQRDIIGINKKLLGRKIMKFHCMECLALYLDTSVEDLLERIEEFKDAGCSLFS